MISLLAICIGIIWLSIGYQIGKACFNFHLSWFHNYETTKWEDFIHFLIWPGINLLEEFRSKKKYIICTSILWPFKLLINILALLFSVVFIVTMFTGFILIGIAFFLFETLTKNFKYCCHAFA